MGESYFMLLVGVALGFVMLGLILQRLFTKYSIRLLPEKRPRTPQILLWMFTDKEMIRRLAVTAGIVIIIRFAFFIPLPGVDLAALRDLLKRMGGGNIPGLLNAFSGGVLERVTIVGLGILPFFSACGIVQLASVFIPPLRRLSFWGEKGREAISTYTYCVTVALCLVQSFFLSGWLQNSSFFSQMQIITMHGAMFRLITMATMTAAVVFLLFAADMITRYGIGNGVAIIFVSGIFVRGIAAARQSTVLAKPGELYLARFLPAIIFCAVIYVLWDITNRTKAVELKGKDNSTFSVHLRPAFVATAPIRYAQSFLLLPMTLASFSAPQWAQGFYQTNTVPYRIVYAVLIIGFSFVYGWIVFSARYVSGLAEKYGYSVEKEKSGISEKEHLANAMLKVLIFTAAVLVAVALVPDLVITLLKLPYLVASLLGGMGIAAAVGVFSDIVRQAEFFKKKNESGIQGWGICYTAFDEIEATIKSEFLKNKGIPALVEPLRFTWGMPIRTAVDQYRIYTPEDKRQEARALIS